MYQTLFLKILKSILTSPRDITRLRFRSELLLILSTVTEKVIRDLIPTTRGLGLRVDLLLLRSTILRRLVPIGSALPDGQ